MPLPKLSPLCLFAATLCCAGLLGLPALAQQSSFDILKGGEVVGSVAASRTKTGDRTLYLLTSYSVMNLIWKQTVTSSMITDYAGDAPRMCMSSIHVNGSLRDSSHMTTDSEGLRCHVHPRPPFRRSEALPWTTARMYFEEPVGQSSVFVESVLTPCSLRTAGPGNYMLTFPNGSESRYVYKRGELHEIHVDKLFINLIFRRKTG